jgi:dienelactone hydrolase
MLSDPAKRSEFNMGAFMGRNGKDKRWPEIEATAKELKGKFKKVGAIGYCYGGWAVFQLGGKGKSLIDAISTAHPSALTLEEIASVDVPVQILCRSRAAVVGSFKKAGC